MPFKQAYAPNVILVLLALFPQLINTAAYPLLANALAGDLHVAGAEVARYSLYNEGAFVVGVLVGTAMMRRLNLRPVFLCLLLADAAVLGAIGIAGSGLEMAVLNVFAGLAGGIFLMVALPPLFTNFDAKYFPASAALMVPCLFGAATVAPLVAAPLEGAGLWRPLFFGEASALLIALLLAIFTVGARRPQEPGAPVDWFAIVACAASIALIFAGVASAASHQWRYAAAIGPFVAGIAGLLYLVAVEYRKRDSLLPLAKLAHSFAIIGFFAAAVGNALYIADVEVVTAAAQRVLQLSPVQIAAASWPLFAMTIVGGCAFAAVLKTKWVPLFTLAGLLAIAVGSALLLGGLPRSQPLSTFLIGYGAATTITPGLFTVGLSLPRDLIVRGIASVEAIRLTLGFISGPLAQHAIVARVADAGAVQTLPAAALIDGMRAAMRYVTGFGFAGVLLLLALLLLYYRRPQAPNLERYVERGEPAFDSPPLKPLRAA